MEDSSEKKLKRKIELYGVLRTQIQHEDTLVNHRITWLLYSQAFLFAFFYTIISNALKANIELNLLLRWIIIIIPLAGIILSALSIGSVWGARSAVKHIRNFWYIKYQEEGNPDLDNPIGNKGKEMPDITFKGTWYLSSLISSVGIPLTIISIWIFCLILDFDIKKELSKDLPSEKNSPIERTIVLGDTLKQPLPDSIAPKPKPILPQKENPKLR